MNTKLNLLGQVAKLAAYGFVTAGLALTTLAQAKGVQVAAKSAFPPKA